MYRNVSPLTILSLVPQTSEAYAILREPLSEDFVSVFTDPSDDTKTLTGIEIGLRQSNGSLTLATLGRGDPSRRGHIALGDAASLSRIQCRFEWESTTKRMQLVKYYLSGATECYHDRDGLERDAIPFDAPEGEHPRLRLQPDINITLVLNDMAEFRVVWHEAHFDELENKFTDLKHSQDTDRTLRPNTPYREMHYPSTRMHLASRCEVTRYNEEVFLDQTPSTEIVAVTEISRGLRLVIKRMKRPPIETNAFECMKREVETLPTLKHVGIILPFLHDAADKLKKHIVRFYDVRWTCNYEYLELFTIRMDGNVESLSHTNHFALSNFQSKSFLFQVVQGFVYLASKGLIHRDVKPSNFLFKRGSSDEHFLFQIADFGSVCREGQGRFQLGTEPYMAPEMALSQLGRQSCKTDMYSVFVTLLQLLDVNGFRHRVSNHSSVVLPLIQGATHLATSGVIARMASQEVTERPSANEVYESLLEDSNPDEDLPLFRTE